MSSCNCDPRPVHIKLLTIDNRTYFVTVLPPADHHNDEIVWKWPHRPHRPIGEDVEGIQNYSLTQADQSA